MMLSKRVVAGVSGSTVPRALRHSQPIVQRSQLSHDGRRAVVARAEGQEGSQTSVEQSSWQHQQQQLLSRRALVGAGLLSVGIAGAAAAEEVDERRGEKVVRTDEEWQQLLTPGQYKILRQAGTELPRTSPLNNEKRRGTFVCAGCGSALFSSDAKYNSGTGWPSFFEPIDGSIVETLDTSIFFMPRTEVRCKSCGGHLGHVFDDGPPPTGLRYCMNGLAMNFVPAGAVAGTA